MQVYSFLGILQEILNRARGEKPVEPADRLRLGQRLQALRKERRLTQEELAERAQLHPTHLAKIETGKSWPSVPALLRLAAALEVPAGSLLEFDPKPSEGTAYQEAAHLLASLDAEGMALARDILAVLRRHRRPSRRPRHRSAGRLP